MDLAMKNGAPIIGLNDIVEVQECEKEWRVSWWICRHIFIT
jgi:hypothetical protein